MKKQYTPGPWRWEFNEKSKEINLVGGKTKYDLTVMDFVRYGMGGAAPRFNVDHGNDLQLMYRADTMGEVVKGREHHANWFKDISHPDAKLIAAAPDLLEACQSFMDSYSTNGHLLNFNVDIIRKAINKALGK